MSKIAIQVDNLGKRYRIGARQKQSNSLRESIKRLSASPFNYLLTTMRPPTEEEILWAIKDISFSVKWGEVLGIIGKNGSGKSTLLKILSRITEPTTGRAKMFGRVGSLLEVGTGFHKELTGRENIYLNGAILGMSKLEIDKKFDEIIDFSGVEKFIDTPVKRYSSGMSVRLAFAVAAHLEPEILVVDEVLSVGDVEFQKKGLDKMQSVTEEGRTVLFVSHNMAAVRNLCPRTLLLDNGVLISDTNTRDAISQYLDRNLQQGAVASAKELDDLVEGVINHDNPTVRFKEIALLDERGVHQESYQSDQGIQVAFTYECLTEVRNLQIIVQIVDDENRPILASQNIDDNDNEYFYKRVPGEYKTSCFIPAHTFGGKRLYVSVHLLNLKVEHLVLNKVLELDVRFQGFGGAFGSWKDTFLRPQFKWQTHRLSDIGN